MDIPSSATSISAMSTAMRMGQKGMGILAIFTTTCISSIFIIVIMIANSLNCIIVICKGQATKSLAAGS